jgi:hypothetical protein
MSGVDAPGPTPTNQRSTPPISSLSRRFVHDLNATEDQIAAAQKDLAAAQANL